MKLLTVNEILEVDQTSVPCVTIYLSANTIRDPRVAKRALNSLTKKAIDVLNGKGWESQAKWVAALNGEIAKSDSWVPYSGSTGIFLSKKLAGYIRFPLEMSNFVGVDETFNLKPLIQWKGENLGFYLCHFTQKQATLFRGTNRCLEVARKVERESLKKNLKQNVHRRLNRDPLVDSDAFVRQVCTQVISELKDETKPLFFSGSVELCDLFQKNCAYPYLYEERIESDYGIPDRGSLLEEVSKVVNRQSELNKMRALDEFLQARKSLMGLSELNDIARASLEGRIKDLFISQNKHLWGCFGRTTGVLQVTDKKDTRDDDILEDIAEEVVRTSGRVFVLSPKMMPHNSIVLATLRW